ncbi:MAG: heavy-metal-associated domain-containing protein [Methanosarcinaceae archaeon]|nr:heavy-metal-associated domain-containing protein [Methanosarcinaceae archaeon]
MKVRRTFIPNKNDISEKGVPGGGNIRETTLIVDDMVCRYCKDMVTRLVSSIDGVSRVRVDVPEHRINVIYDSKKTDAYVIKIKLLEAGYRL